MNFWQRGKTKQIPIKTRLKIDFFKNRSEFRLSNNMTQLISEETRQNLLGKVFVAGLGFQDPKYIRVVGFTPKRVLVENLPSHYIQGEGPYCGQFIPDPCWLREHPVTAPASQGYEKALWKPEEDVNFLQYGGSHITDFYHEITDDELPHREYMPD